MEFSQLSDRAMQIHAAFAARAQRTGIRPWTREEVMQGFVGDVGDLMKLVMAKAGARPIPTPTASWLTSSATVCGVSSCSHSSTA